MILDPPETDSIHEKAPITILLADDHPLLRQGLRMLLTADPGLQVVAEVADGEEALRQIPCLSPEVAILDIDMPGRAGLQLCASSIACVRGLASSSSRCILESTYCRKRSRSVSGDAS